MSALIEDLRAALKSAAAEWSWKLSYAPKPGQQRIKIICQNLENPALCKTFIFSEEFCKALAASELARHVAKLLSSLPPAPLPPSRVDKGVLPKVFESRAESLDSQYRVMRKSYAMNLADMKESSHKVPRRNPWLILLEESLRNMQFLRK